MSPGKDWEWPGYTKVIHRTEYEAIDPTNPKNSTAGKVVVVTGGGAGVGAAIAKAFVRSGAKAVAILGRREAVLAEGKKKLEEAGSSKILTHVADVVDYDALSKAFAAIEKEVGKVDIVVANAGYMPVELAAESDIANWWSAYEINVKGLFLTFRAWLPHKSSDRPTFIYVNAAGAHFAPVPKISAYCSAKTGAANLINYLHVENPDLHITSLHPGILETNMLETSGLRALMSPDDISLPAGFTVWLASPAADGWTDGRLLWSHWDVDELLAMKDEIVKNNELVMVLNGWPKPVEIDVRV